PTCATRRLKRSASGTGTICWNRRPGLPLRQRRLPIKMLGDSPGRIPRRVTVLVTSSFSKEALLRSTQWLWQATYLGRGSGQRFSGTPRLYLLIMQQVVDGNLVILPSERQRLLSIG